MRESVKLEGCKDHKVCYIRFKDGKVDHSEPRDDVVVDRDEKGEIIGIEFYNGWLLKEKREK